jgi:hypothetical protein
MYLVKRNGLICLYRRLLHPKQNDEGIKKAGTRSLYVDDMYDVEGLKTFRNGHHMDPTISMQEALQSEDPAWKHVSP